LEHIKKYGLLGLLLINVGLHLPYINRELTGYHVWRQTHLYEEDFNIFNPKRAERGNGDGIFRMEFPLMQWLIAACYKVFGNHIFITRLIMLLIGCASICGIYSLAYTWFKNELVALFTAWCFCFSPVVYYYTVNPLPDNLALCFCIWSLVYVSYWIKLKKVIHLWAYAIFLSLATLCKLPFAVYYAMAFSAVLIHSYQHRIVLPKYILPFIATVIFPIAWYALVIPSWNHTGIREGIFGHSNSLTLLFDYAIGNLVSTLPELLVNYASFPFLLAGFYHLQTKTI
jgi:4-amino-4-deoxy-L-arabinose transferase-like glycosyltransferase